ncbi:S-adenosyl-L-methionine-dependent methyltransferase [Xylaria sp. FL0043]|nr:S-adenosyl-L-methionine-dependent methyltransferase [Xylaria sp. FL0043]
MAARSLEQLSSIVSRNAAVLSQKLEVRNISSPTIQDVNAPDLSEVDSVAATELVNAARELQAIVQSREEQLNLLGFSAFDSVSVGILLEFNIPSLVPLEGAISLHDLSAKTGLSEDKLSRIVRYAITNFILREPEPGAIAHTALSAALARDPKFATYLRLCLVDLAPVNAALPAALRKWPTSDFVTECAVNAAFDTPEPFFAWLSRDATRQARFDQGMAGFAGTGRSSDVEIAAFPWGTALPTEAVVVDVGGGKGHFSKALARAFPKFKVTVQDRKEVVEAAVLREDDDGNSGGTTGSIDGVRFQAHSFFEPQPLHGADVYFLRQVIHDWPDREAAGILRALTPALKPGARVLVSEYGVPSPSELQISSSSTSTSTSASAEQQQQQQLNGHGLGILEAKHIRQMDLQMMAVLNAKERSADEFAKLFALADERLKFKGAHRAPGDRKVCIFEAVWEP